MTNYYLQKITTGLNKYLKIKKKTILLCNLWTKTSKYIGLMKITKLQKKTELRFVVTGILLQLVPFFWLIFKLL